MVECVRECEGDILFEGVEYMAFSPALIMGGVSVRRGEGGQFCPRVEEVCDRDA